MRRDLSEWFSYAALTALVLSALVPLGTGRAAAATKCVPHIPTSGDVLVTGGVDGAGKITGNTEFFDVATHQWMTGCPSKNAHVEGRLMPWSSAKGMKLIQIAGNNAKGLIMNGTDVYDPLTGSFKSGPGVPAALEDFAAVSLADGSMMVIGGFTRGYQEVSVKTAAILGVRSWKKVKAKMTTARGGLCATRLTSTSLNGQVLIVGGVVDRENALSPKVLSSVELYDPATKIFTASSSGLTVARSFPTCTVLQDGKVLVTGGVDGTGNGINVAEIYDPATDTFTETTGLMNIARFNHTATLLLDGTVLVAGGDSGASQSAEIFDESTGTFTATGMMTDPRDLATATLLSDGTVLLAGGLTTHGALNSAEIYDPVAQTFTPTSPMNFAHYHANAAIIP